jgi:broad-specificity NMP kinase
MKTKILITGIAGSGKSTAHKELCRLGYESYDIETIDGMFDMFRKDTGEVYKDYSNADAEKIKNAEWLCDVNKLKELLEQQKEDIAFYCGVASNMDDIIPLFDKTILLQTNPEILHKRLSSREGTGDMGNTEEGRKVVLGWKDWFEDKVKKHEAIVVNADGVIEDVVKKIIDLI